MRWLLLLFLISGCASAGEQQETPARRTDNQEAGRAELQALIGSALDQSKVLISPQAFQRGDVLSIERTPRRTPAGIRLDGRNQSVPELFRLHLRADGCYLRYGERVWRLSEVTCEPIDR